MTDTRTGDTRAGGAGCTDRHESAGAQEAQEAVSACRAPGPAAPASAPQRPGTRKVRVRICPDGPVLVSGADSVITGDGEEVPTGRRTVALCRCGRSSLAPWCDSTHKLLPPGTIPG